MDQPTEIDVLRAEFRRIQLDSLLSAERHYAAETPWYMVNYLLGIPSAVLAAVGGVTSASDALKESKTVIAVALAVVVAVLSALLTVLNPSARAAQHHQYAKGFEAIYRRAGRRFRGTMSDSDIADMKRELGEVSAEYEALLRAEPALPGRAYRVADTDIRSGRTEVKATEEDLREVRERAVVANRIADTQAEATQQSGAAGKRRQSLSSRGSPGRRV